MVRPLTFDEPIDLDEDIKAELRQQDERKRRIDQNNIRHPDPRDPDHIPEDEEG